MTSRFVRRVEGGGGGGGVRVRGNRLKVVKKSGLRKFFWFVFGYFLLGFLLLAGTAFFNRERHF